MNIGNPCQVADPILFEHRLIHYLQERRVIPRLSVIIAGGFFCENTSWTRFLFQGIYDPRLFIFIFDFAIDFTIFEETGRKKFRSE